MMLRWYISLGLLLASLTLAETRAALGQGPTIEQLQPGLAGVFRVGYWTPVRIRVTAGQEPLACRLELLAPDGDGLPTRYGAEASRETIDVPAGKSRDLVRYVKIGRREGFLTARLIDEERVLAERRLALTSLRFVASTQQWILSYGAEVPLAQVLRPRRSTDPIRVVQTHLESVAELPNDWFGLSGVEIVVLTTSDPAWIEALSTRQIKALGEWIRLGGVLILSAGKEAQRIGGEGAPLAAFVPGPVRQISEQRVAAGLETFARAEQPLGAMTVAEISEVQGRVESYIEGRASGTLPAIVRSPLGLGQIVFLAFDVDLPPVSTWSATPQLLRNVLEPRPRLAEAAAADGDTRRVTHFGYDELSGQLRSALDHFPAGPNTSGVQLVSFFAVAALLILYLACISAGDYFLLARLVRRMSWTWVTFPLLVLLFSVFIVVLGRHWRGQPRVRLNQVDVVDIDLTDGTTRGTTYAHLYSPQTSAYDLALTTNVPLGGTSSRGSSAAGALLSWQGLPGGGLGGFEMTMARPMPADPYLVRADAAAPPQTYLYDVPVAVGSTKSLIGQWWDFRTLETPYVLTSGSDGLLNGDLRNPLNVELEDVLLAYDRWAYRLEGTLSPRAVIRVNSLQRRDLEWRLTQRRVMHSKTSYSTTPWEPDSRDVPRILEIMMFHEAAGGDTYTTLTQRYQDHLDLSEHLLLGRAVLLGRAESSAAEIYANDGSLTSSADRRWTWYRLVFPVQPAPSDSAPAGEPR